jgi:hypothetical protein
MSGREGWRAKSLRFPHRSFRSGTAYSWRHGSAHSTADARGSSMERLLERIVEKNSAVALLDVTGVPTIDSRTAQTVRALQVELAETNR